MSILVPHRSCSSLIPSSPFYDSKLHSHRLDVLISAAIEGTSLHRDGGDGLSVKQHLDSVYHQAKNNCGESLELLQNIALGKGEVATLAQDHLCRIVCQDEGGTADVAQQARAQCQSLITDFPQWINNTFLQDRFTLLFIAGTHLKDEGPCVDNIPALVKEKIMQLDGLPIKPKWYTPQQGTFDAVDYATFNHNNGQLRYALSEDGACQFRAALMLHDRDESWLDVDKSVILREIENNGWEPKIHAAINNAIENMGEIYGYLSMSDGECVDALIYNNTIANGEFTLYSPQAVREALPEALRKIKYQKNGNDYLSDMSVEQWENFTHLISENLIYQLGINVHDSQLPYAECNVEQAHYSVIVATDDRFPRF